MLRTRSIRCCLWFLPREGRNMFLLLRKIQISDSLCKWHKFVIFIWILWCSRLVIITRIKARCFHLVSVQIHLKLYRTDWVFNVWNIKILSLIFKCISLQTSKIARTLLNILTIISHILKKEYLPLWCWNDEYFLLNRLVCLLRSNSI